ncbi:MAG: hypothetical protein M3126_08750 [Candidatus Eremiobacteraeota bacterium]|nr:hypothetical protein [Candidatus Eremiobacteraeota bacterium]
MDDDVLDDAEPQSGESSASQTITNLIKHDRSEPAPRDPAVYSDTDLNPNADDQADLHHGHEDDEE